MANPMPGVRPAVPHFSSGPCAKRPGWTLQALKDAFLGRSHRAQGGKAKLKRAIEETRAVLEVPVDYLIGIVPASDTGAVEMAMWSMLGPRPVTMIAWESFGEGWVTDVAKAAQAEGRSVDQSALWAASRSLERRSQVRHRIHLERHHVRCACPERRLDCGGSRRRHDLRCNLRRIRAAARLVQARCGDLLVAEGARRRSRPRHADPVAARGGTARE